MMPAMRRLLLVPLFFVAACATTSAPSAVVPVVTRPTDDANSVLRALDRVDAGLVGAEGALQVLEQKVREKAPDTAPPPR